MAKRKRLDPARLIGIGPETGDDADVPAGLETKSTFPSRPPIADVARAAATEAALAELGGVLAEARAEGRMIERLPLDAVDETHLVRDRVDLDPDEMQGLVDSLRARGQQTAIEVVPLAPGRWGLISGWRRLTALRRLRREDGTDPGVLAVVRQPGEAAEAYLAMVEENEVRVGLSFYERARIVVRATDRGVFRSDRDALARLFAAAPRARRSKIGAFVRVVRALDETLAFPTALSERDGLRLAMALDADPALGARIAAALAASPAADPAAEARLLAQLREPAAERPERRERVAPAPAAPPGGGLTCRFEAGAIRLEGPLAGDPEFRRALLDWLDGQGVRAG